MQVWAEPVSLAATQGIAIAFCSSGYLDVSVPRVGFIHLWIQCMMLSTRIAGCPIRKSPGLSLFTDSPKLIAGYHVLHRLLVPRHPPCAINSLTINPEDHVLTTALDMLDEKFDGVITTPSATSIGSVLRKNSQNAYSN